VSTHTVVSFDLIICQIFTDYAGVCMFRSVTMHDRPAKMFANLDIAGRHKLFHRLDIFRCVFFEQMISVHGNLLLFSFFFTTDSLFSLFSTALCSIFISKDDCSSVTEGVLCVNVGYCTFCTIH